MKSIIINSISAILIAITFFISSCTDENFLGMGIKGKGPINEHRMPKPVFTGILLDIPAELIVDTSINSDIIIHAQNNIYENISVNVVGGTLEIRYLKNVTRTEKPKIFISQKQLNRLKVRGSGIATITNSEYVSSMNIEVDGSGSIFAYGLHANELKTKLKGSGVIEMTGLCNKLYSDIDGSGDIRLFNLSSLDALCGIKGSGHIEVNVIDHLNANVDGSGKIFYKGNPEVLQSVSGSGKIKKVN